jgi:putative Holliday junction resolvase
METNHKYETVLALDVGEKRIGVARAHLSALFPQAVTTLEHPERFADDIAALCESEQASALVVGLPRGLGGQDTAQTAKVREFVAALEPRLQIPVYWSDEALTSEKAEAELRGRGKPYVKADIDALAAVYILEDYIKEHPENLSA